MISRWLVIPTAKKRHKIKSDPQRHRIYALERELIGQSINTQSKASHLRDVLLHACTKYNVTAPVLHIIDSKDPIFGWTDEDGIHLNESFHGCNTFTLLHELAHYIMDRTYEPPFEYHGPEFVKVYMDLMHRYRILPKYAFKVLAERHKVKYK